MIYVIIHTYSNAAPGLFVSRRTRLKIPSQGSHQCSILKQLSEVRQGHAIREHGRRARLRWSFGLGGFRRAMIGRGTADVIPSQGLRLEVGRAWPKSVVACQKACSLPSMGPGHCIGIDLLAPTVCEKESPWEGPPTLKSQVSACCLCH